MIGRRFNQETKDINKYSSVSPRETVKSENLVKRYRDREKTLLDSSGSYYSWFKRELEHECHCYNRRVKSGHVNCPVCFGTGYLKSYEKHGYKTYTFSRTWPGLSMMGRFSDGWGYGEVMESPFELVSPWIESKGIIDIDNSLVDKFYPETESRVEVTYDGTNWFDIEDGLDLTNDSFQFRLSVDSGGSRFIRVRFRTKEYTNTREQILPKGIYILASSPEKQSGDVTSEKEKVDIVSESDAWTLEKVKVSDFLIDESGVYNPLRIGGRYIINGVRTGVHGFEQSEHRRDFQMKYIPKNSYLHNIYGVLA